MKIKKMIKTIVNKVISPFQKTSYINNYIYSGDLLKGRTALITGGTSGIGFAIAKTYLKNGCNVIITGRDDKKILSAVGELKKNIQDDEKQIVDGMVFDISDSINIEKNFNKIIELIKPNKIDILVNNAGVIMGSKIGSTKIEDYELCFKTNLEGSYFLSQIFFNYLKSEHLTGNILNVLSSSANRPAVKPYTLTKWGLKGLTIGMAKKFIKYGVVVNGIAPGPTYTPMLVGNSTDDKNIKLESNPSGRYTTPEEIANGALFLVSDMGKMIVGDIIYMTGGAGIVTVDDISY